MNHFISGAIMMASGVAGLFFLRFWKRTRDRLFLMFALAFWILAVNRVPMVFMEQLDETRIYVYGVRLLAFTLILVAIVDKNRKADG